MAEDGSISIGFDGSELEQGLDQAAKDVDGLVAPLENVEGAAEGAAEALDEAGKAAKETGDKADKAGGRFARFRAAIAKVFGEDGALSQKNMKSAVSSMTTIINSSKQISRGMTQIATTGSSVGDKIDGAMSVASSAITAFATGGPITLALTVMAGLARQIGEVMNAAEKEAEAAQESFRELAKEAAAAGKSIRLMQLEEQKSQALTALRALEQRRDIAKAQRDDARKARDIQDRLAREGDARFKESEHKRQRERAEANDAVLKQLESQIKQQMKNLGLYNAQVVSEMAMSQADSIQQAVKASEQAVQAMAENEKKNEEAKRKKEEAKRKAKKAKAKKAAPEPGDPIDAYAAYYKAQVEEQKRFLAEERAIEEAKAQEQAQRAAARVEQEKNEAALIAQIDEELAAKRAEIREKLRESEKAEREQRMAQMKDDLEIARVGLTTITSTLFDMAKEGEMSISGLLSATLSSIGQHMVAQGTQFIFEGTAKTLLKQPEGPALIGVGLAEVAAGVSLGAASGAIARQSTDAGGAPAQSPADTRQTQAAAVGSSGQGGPVVITFEGDVYDKRGVANVLNQGLGMARHRRLRGA